MIGCALCNALTGLLAQSVVVRRTTFDWHSATFSGQRLVIEMCTNAAKHVVDRFVQTIGDHDFELNRHFVADIQITARGAHQSGGTMLTLEALMLDDEI